MNDNLDKKLEAWKEQRSLKDVQFTSEEKFAADFFEKAALLPEKKVAKKTFWPVVCKLVACQVVVLCAVVLLVKLNKNNEMAKRDMSLAKVAKTETVEINAPQVPEAIEVVAEEAESKQVKMKSRQEELFDAFKTTATNKVTRITPMSSEPPLVLMDKYDGRDVVTMSKKPGTDRATEGDMTADKALPKAKFAEVETLYALKRENYKYNSNIERFEEIRRMMREAEVVTPLSKEDRQSNTASWNTEEYKPVSEKPFLAVTENPLSTFGADVDTASYGMMRRMILQGRRLPPPTAVRIEEMLNYFHYDYPMPEKDDMMRPHFEMQASPWNPSHQLLLVGVQAKTIPLEELPASHYVFLIDNSGSMSHVFPMVKDAMTALARQLRKGDTVSMVTYGGGVNVLLEATWDPEVVCAEIAKLSASGYTPGGEGIQTAYQIAERHFIKGGNNRIVLITDGDFNVGTSSEAELVEMVEAKQKSCIYLTVVGCGMGNYKDNKMKMLANKGNGNYFYLDEPREARKIFVKGMTSNMVTVCRDVKLQLEFNPSNVFAYRQLGYELREMASSDFRNDAKDSGEVGMGQQVTVLYELVLAEASEDVKKQAVPGWQPLKYAKLESIANDELLTFRIRYKLPQGDAPAVEKTTALTTIPTPTNNWNWASSVAEFALRLRRSPYAGDADYSRAVKRAQIALGDDADGYRAEFLMLIHRTQDLDTK